MTSIRQAFSIFEEREYKKACKAVMEQAQTERWPEDKTTARLNSIERVKVLECEKVLLCGMLPPIQKMDKDLTQLKECVHLSLSTNLIEKIGPGLKELKKLKVLSLGRNLLRKLEQLDIPGLEQLWISYNKIDKLTGLDKLKNLKVLYMSNNNISSWGEIDRLANQCPELTEVLFYNNPICTEAASPKEYRLNLLARMPKLTRIDGVQVDRDKHDKE